MTMQTLTADPTSPPQGGPRAPEGPAPGGPHDPKRPPAQDPKPGDSPQDHRAPGDKHPVPKLGARAKGTPASVAGPDQPAPSGGPAVPVPPLPAPSRPGPEPDRR